MMPARQPAPSIGPRMTIIAIWAGALPYSIYASYRYWKHRKDAMIVKRHPTISLTFVAIFMMHLLFVVPTQLLVNPIQLSSNPPIIYFLALLLITYAMLVAGRPFSLSSGVPPSNIPHLGPTHPTPKLPAKHGELLS